MIDPAKRVGLRLGIGIAVLSRVQLLSGGDCWKLRLRTLKRFASHRTVAVARTLPSMHVSESRISVVGKTMRDMFPILVEIGRSA